MQDSTQAPSTRYSVYADLSRPLSVDERSRVVDALDASVPESGCVGQQNGPNDEVYFCVDAASEGEAISLASIHMSRVLQEAGLDTTFKLALQAQ